MNSMGELRLYRIKRIRLVNFHNFQNETIDVSGCGHLFLLGDNGSGKTTVLDAVQYVLTGGNHMEFNSAARIAGGRQEGRRVQGIVLRYNVDTGPINDGGGISYAGLELCDSDGTLLTIGVGLSAYSMEERVQRWGIIISGPLEQVPWLSLDGEKLRITPQRQMRDALLDKNAFYTIGAYEKEIARRLFTNDEIFGEICRFLSMGKAYREIAASAADYHELFKTLLPEPKTDLFERIIQSLRSLDEANNLLEDMEKKLSYLSILKEMVNTIADQRECIARYTWLKIHFERNTVAQTVSALEAELKRIDCSLEETEKRLTECSSQQMAVQRRIADLRSADSAGLIRQEKELREDLSVRRQQLSVLTRSVSRFEEQLLQTEKNYESVHDNLRNVIAQLHQAGSDTSGMEGIDGNAFCRSLDSITMFDTVATTTDKSGADKSGIDSSVVEVCRQIPADELVRLLEERSRSLQRELDRYVDSCKNLSSEHDAIASERENLEKNSRLKPAIEGLDTALRTLSDAGFEANLLYELLEWKTDLDGQSRSAVEECIGIDVLSIIVVQGNEIEAAARVIYACAAGIRVCAYRQEPQEIAEWMRISFDLQTSLPMALKCLAHEMSSQSQPWVESVDGHRVLSFRSHKSRLTETPSCWIGQEERRVALQAKITALTQRMEEIGRETRRLSNQINAHRECIKSLDSIRNRIVALMRDLLSIAGNCEHVRRELVLRRESVQQECLRRDELSTEIERFAARLEVLAELIQKQGLEDLERRIGLLQEQESALDSQNRDILRQQGALQQRHTNIVQEQSLLARRDQELAEALTKAEQPIRIMIDQKHTDIAFYVLRTRGGAQFKSMESIEIAIRDGQRREAATVGGLVEKLGDPVFGALFGFNYDADANLLTDRREKPIGELAASQAAAIEEQRQVINERTAELFKKIIVTEMVSFFGRHISRLEQMVRSINILLANRTFGNTRYRLELQKEERYAGFIDSVKKFNPFTPGSEEALKQFIDDNREEIINAEVNTIPKVLDYRNWYVYHLRMYTTGEQGIIIDRRTKSVGSGGEQAVPNYLTILTIAHFLFKGNGIRLHTLLFDEAFYGIDAGRRDQLMGFASDLSLQLLVASPDQDGVKREIPLSTTILVVKDSNYDVHLYPFHWDNPGQRQLDLFETPGSTDPIPAFEHELGA